MTWWPSRGATIRRARPTPTPAPGTARSGSKSRTPAHPWATWSGSCTSCSGGRRRSPARSIAKAAREALPKTSGDVSRAAGEVFPLRLDGFIAYDTQDFARAAGPLDRLRRLAPFNDSVEIATCLYPQALALSHDEAGALRELPA